MSDELRLPDDLRLPDQLAATEAKLAAHPLASSLLNRDELLYRAGWAAAEGKLSLASPSPSQDGARGGTIAAWSLTSAALAASLAVAATLLVVSGNAPQAVEEAGGFRPPLAEVVEATPSEAPAASPRDEGDLLLANLDAMLRLNRTAPSASLWAAIGRPQRQRWDQPIIVSTAASAPTKSRPATTARGLLDELLPSAPATGGAAPSAAPWLRRPPTSGEDTI